MNQCESLEFFTQNEDSENDDRCETQEKRLQNRADHYKIKTIAGNIFITPANSTSGQSHVCKMGKQGMVLHYEQPCTPCRKTNRHRSPERHKKHHRRSRSLSITIRPSCKKEVCKNETARCPTTTTVNNPCNSNWGPMYNPPSKSCSNYSVGKASSKGFSTPCARVCPVYQPIQDKDCPTEDDCREFIQNLSQYQEELRSARNNFAPADNSQSNLTCGEGPDECEYDESPKEVLIRADSPAEDNNIKEYPWIAKEKPEADDDEEHQNSGSQFGDRFNFSPTDELSCPTEVKISAAKERQKKQAPTKATSEHVFPFIRGSSGNLRVETNMIAFESKQVAVLVDDPTKTRVRFQQRREQGCRVPPPVPPMPKGFSNCPSPAASPRELATPGANPMNCRSNPTSASCAASSGIHSSRTAGNKFENKTHTKVCGLDVNRNCFRTSNPEEIPECCSAGTQNQCRSSKDFVESLRVRLRGAIHHDLKVVIGDQEFPCHSIALQAYSKFFDCMKRPKELIHRIELPEHIIRPEDFPNLMDWILLDDASKCLVISHCNVLSLYAAAQYLGIPGLKEHCLAYIAEKIKTGDSTILQMYEEACGKAHCKDVLGLLGSKLVQLFPMVYKSKKFLKLGPNELITLIDSDDVKIQSELQIYDTALRWLLFDWDTRAEYAIPVMRCVRFGLLSPLQLTQIQHCAEAANMPDYCKIYFFPEIKQMLLDGLTFSILRENYKARPGEFNKWVDWSKVNAPRPRRNLDHADIFPLSSRMPVDGYPDCNEEQFEPKGCCNNEASPRMGDNEFCRRSCSKASHASKKGCGSRREKFTETSPRSTCRRGRSDQDSDVGEDFQQKLEQDRDAISQILHIRLEEPVCLSFPQQEQITEQDEVCPSNNYQARHHEAATVIQSHVRGYLTRQRAGSNRTSIQSEENSQENRNQTLDLMRTKPLLIPGRQAVLLFGGMNPIEPYDRSGNNSQCIYRFDPETNSWSDVGRLPEPRSHCGVISEQNMIYIFGGDDPRKTSHQGKKVPSAKSWSLNPLNGKWQEMSSMNVPRTNFGFCNFRGKIYVFGGKGISGKPLSNCERYNLEDNTWEHFASLPAPCMSMAVSKFGNSIFVVGGVGKGTKLPISDSVFIYEPRNDVWTRDVPLQFGRCYAQLESHYEKLYLIGGAGREGREDYTKSLTDVCVYEDGEWEPVGVLKKPRHGHTMVKIGKHFLIMGGVSSDTMEPLNTVEIYNTETNRSSSRVANMPQKLTGMTAIVI